MASRKPRKPESVSRRGSISEHASDWIRQFSKQLEDNFIDSALSLPAGRLHRATTKTRQSGRVFWALLDSGMDTESFAETVGRVLIEKRPGSIEWNSRVESTAIRADR